jgi:hypothetical protein
MPIWLYRNDSSGRDLGSATQGEPKISALHGVLIMPMFGYADYFVVRRSGQAFLCRMFCTPSPPLMTA